MRWTLYLLCWATATPALAKDPSSIALVGPDGAIVSIANKDKNLTLALDQPFVSGWRAQGAVTAPLDEETRIAAITVEEWDTSALAPGVSGWAELGWSQNGATLRPEICKMFEQDEGCVSIPPSRDTGGHWALGLSKGDVETLPASTAANVLANSCKVLGLQQGSCGSMNQVREAACEKLGLKKTCSTVDARKALRNLGQRSRLTWGLAKSAQPVLGVYGRVGLAHDRFKAYSVDVASKPVVSFGTEVYGQVRGEAVLPGSWAVNLVGRYTTKAGPTKLGFKRCSGLMSTDADTTGQVCKDAVWLAGESVTKDTVTLGASVTKMWKETHTGTVGDDKAELRMGITMDLNLDAGRLVSQEDSQATRFLRMQQLVFVIPKSKSTIGTVGVGWRAKMALLDDPTGSEAYESGHVLMTPFLLFGGKIDPRL